MTRGHRGSLLLRCRALSSPSPCRFIPAHTTSTGRTAHSVKRHRSEPSPNPIQQPANASCGWIDSAGSSMSMPRPHEMNGVFGTHRMVHVHRFAVPAGYVGALGGSDTVPRFGVLVVVARPAHGAVGWSALGCRHERQLATPTVQGAPAVL